MLCRRTWEAGKSSSAAARKVYAAALPLCSDLYLTLVKRQVEGDAFFPPFEDRFTATEVILDCADFSILRYQRKMTGRLA
ncbi:MAG: dihydrofolate reductase [Limisphaerales bacterium]